jgi:hypothetical protein
MNRFSDEIRIISAVAWVVALLLGGCIFILLLYIAIPSDPKMSTWAPVGQIAFASWPALLLMVWVLLIGYVNADARRRGMRYVMWTVLSIVIPNGIGIILYFVMRDPLPQPCPSCGHMAGPGFVFCPQCGAELSPACPSCKRAVKADWKRCAYCGTQLSLKA